MTGDADYRLINFVDQELRTGKTVVQIPRWMLIDIMKETMQEVRRLCNLSGASIKIED